MIVRINDIRFIGGCLAIFYAVTLAIYEGFLRAPEYNELAFFVSVILAILMIGSIGVAFLKTWGRILVIAGNILMVFYLTYRYSLSLDFLPISYFYVSLTIIVFLFQARIKTQFDVGKRRLKWYSVLLIDDDEEFVNAIRPELLKNGFSTLKATSIDDAFQIAKYQKPDAIVLNDSFVGGKGKECLKRIRMDFETMKIPLVYLSANSTAQQVNAILEEGVMMHFDKPVSSQVLMPAIQQVLDPAFRQKKTGRSVLIVDDDETLIKSVRPILVHQGYFVLTAGNGEDGLTISRRQKPDLIFLDVIMPGMKGREVCKKLKADPETKNIPVVFLTAKDSPDDIAAEMAVGAAAHLTKPVEPKKLMTMIDKIINQK
jgi:CheY-like chemotaxis protein